MPAIHTATGTYSLADELDRKTIEALDAAMNDYTRGVIGPSETRAALRAILMTTRGLISEPITLCVEQELSLLPEAQRRTAAFVGQGSIYFLSHLPGEAHFVVRQLVNGTWQARNVPGAPPDEVSSASRQYDAFIKKLQSLKYEQL